MLSILSCYKKKTKHETTWFHIFTLMEKGPSVQRLCYVQCFKRNWVNSRLLGVNYVSQTVGLTEMLNERYQLTIHSHNCLCPSAEHMLLLSNRCPALLLFLSLSIPCDLNASQTGSCSTRCKTSQTVILLFRHLAVLDILVTHGDGQQKQGVL